MIDPIFHDENININTASEYELPFLTTVSIVVTLKCQVECPHCLLDAGPHRSEEISLSELYNWIEQIADYSSNIKMLSLTGGEPFFNIDKLEKITSFARKRGLFTSAVSNGYWAKDQETAQKILHQLDALDAIIISADPHHQVKIPLERVVYAVQAALERGMPCSINICTENPGSVEHLSFVENLKSIIGPVEIREVRTIPLGRASEWENISNMSCVPYPPKSACVLCSAPVIFPDGRIMGCIGPLIHITGKHPLILGNLKKQTFKEIIDQAEQNPILHSLRIWGPNKLVELIQESGPSENLPPCYFEGSICTTCFALMSNPLLVRFLENLTEEAPFKEKIAFARYYYFGESKMIKDLGLFR